MTSHRAVRQIGLIASVALGLAAASLVGVPSQAAEPPAKIGSCLDVREGLSNTSTYKIVDCEAKHNSEVFDIVAYPSGAGAPSTLTESEIDDISQECSYSSYQKWLGKKIELPLRLWWFFVSLPSDETWSDGDRNVLCRTVRPTDRYDAMRYTGSIPKLINSTPIEGWLNCLSKAPKSGGMNKPRSCGAKSTWLLIGGEQVKGEVTSKYPQDLQPAADKKCAPYAKKYGKKGAKVTAALLPKKVVGSGPAYTECFIQRAQWNGKVR